MGSALQPERVVASLRRIFEADVKAGSRRRLPEYQRLFVGFESVVAAEYARLCDEHGIRDEPVPVTPAAATRAGAVDDAAPRPVAAGERFGPFRLVRELGRGGMGIVWLAEDTRLPRRVALKVLPPHLTGSESLRARFEREALLAARLDDPGICPIFEAGEVHGAPYIAMRFVEGETLAALVARASGTEHDVSMVRVPRRASSAHGVRPAAEDGDARASTPSASEARGEVARVVHLVERVARSLHVAHEAGLVHRDVKPQNVMVTPDGDPVLLDFGLAREEDGEGHGMTQSGTLLGTPAYMSPEQLLAQHVRLDRRTDVYSLGVTLYECVTLKLPFEAPTAQALYQRILATEAEDPRRTNAALPRDLCVVIETALQKDRERRYATALDLAEDLRRVREGEPIRARPIGRFERLRRWADRNRATAAFAAALFVALAAGLVTTAVLLRDAREERDEKEIAWREEARQRAAAQSARADAEKALKSARAVGLTSASAEASREDGMLALLLAIEAAQIESSPATVTQLHAALSGANEAATITAHTGPVRAVEFSPSGDRVLTASEDGTARIFDLTGRELAVLKGHEKALRAAHFSPAGDLIVTASQDGTARLWDVDGHERAVLRGHAATVLAAAFSPSGDRVVTAGVDGTARVHDVSGRELAVARGHEGDVMDVEFAPGGQLFATAGIDGTARMSNLAGETTAVCRGHAKPISDLCFSPRGDLLLTGSGDKTARLWSLDGTEKAVMQEGANSVFAVAFDASGEHLVTASPSRACKLWDPSGRPLASFEQHTSRVLAAAFARTGGLVVSCGEDQTARVWRLDGREVVALRGHRGVVRDCAFSPDGRRVATASDDGTVRIWEVRPGEVAVQAVHGNFISTVAWSAAGDRILTTSSDGTARVWDADGRPVAALAGHTEWVRGGLFLEDGRALTWSNDNTARLWDHEGRPAGVFSGHADSVSAAAVSPSSDLVATTSWDGTVRLWGLDGSVKGVAPSEGRMTINPSFSPDGELVASIVDQGAARICDRAGRVVASVGSHDQYAAITSAVWSPDGRSLVTAERSGTVRWWTRDGKEERSFLPGPAGPATLRFSPDGRLLAVVGVDRIVRLLEPSGRVVATLQGHRDSPIGVRWVKCGGPILTFAGSEMRLWTEDGSEICVLRSPGDKIRGAVTDPAGRRIAVGDQDGVLRIWIVDPADLLAFGERRRTRAFSAEERSRYAALLGEAK